ncbi:MAG: histidine kinase [Gammaproteobacteria bacterium]|nr:histidine kinase [Gammaproteobacteria bacterium]MBU1414651.1 histidine kinase [Gammaproteobacteria bacterium]
MTAIAPTRQPKRVKAKFIGPLAAALAFIMCVFAIAIYGIETYIHDQDLAARSTAVVRLFAHKLDRDTNLMMATVRAMFANPAMEDAFRRGDRKTIAELGGPLFKVLRSEHRITHLYLIRPDFVNLYRFHSPDEFGDVIDRVSLLQARDRQVPASGLELGAMGTLTLRLVVPWRRDGVLIGYIEIGEEIEHLIAEIRHSLSVDLLALVEKHFISRDQWQRGQALMQRVGDWDRFATHAALAQTTDRFPATLDDRLLGRLLAGRTADLQDQGRSLHLAIVPLEDAGKKHIGELIVMRDITDLAATFRWSIVAVTVISLLAAGGVLGIFYIALERVERDYQRQHDLEHRLLRLDTEHRRILQLEKLSAVGTMVGGIAHQLNNPLVGVVNLAQLAEREADDPARTRELLRGIRSAGEDCREFVKRMLAFSKVSGFESRTTAMASLIEDTVLLFRQAERRHLRVETRLPEEPVVLMVDPVLIRHALFNLLVNAAQATADADGVIRIELARQDDATRGLPGWSLSVSDQGCGMAAEVLTHVFEPFYTTRSDGTGLGLPVVQHVALLHDGNVTVDSEPGHGTRFALWLPDTATETSSSSTST